jgi:phage gp29-like protein
MQLEFMAAAQGNDTPFRAMMTAMDAAISKAILGQTLTSSEGQHGTQALGQVHNEVRLDILKSDASRIDETVTSQLIAPWVLLNIPGADPKRLPRYVTDVPEPEDLALYADALPKLAAAGMKIGLADMHRRLRIPLAEDGEELLRGPAAAPKDDPDSTPEPAPRGTPKGPGVTPAPGKREAPPKKTALAGELPPQQRDAMDDLVDQALADWELMLAPIVEPMLAEIDKAVAAGESLASLRDRLPELLQHMDARPMAERLARAAFMARLAGAADLDLYAEEQEP